MTSRSIAVTANDPPGRNLAQTLPVLVLFIVSFGTLNVAMGDANPSKVDALKDFLSHPPVVAQMLFERRVPPESENPKDSEETIRLHVLSRFEARWQPGAVFLRQFLNRQNAGDHSYHEVLVAACKGEYWLLDKSQFADKWVEIRNQPSTNYVESEVPFQARLVQEVLNLGVMYVEPGTFRWRGNHFSASGRVPLVEAVVNVDGKLIVSEQGTPIGFKVIYRYPTTLVEHRIDFSYDNPPEGWNLPSGLTRFWTDGQKETELSKVTIQEIRLQANNLSRDSFDPQPYIKAHNKQVRLLEDDQRFLVLPTGLKYFDSVRATPARRPNPTNGSSPPFTYVAWAGLNLGIFLLAVNLIKHQNRKAIHEH